MYVAVKGGERAIDNAHAWLAEERRGDDSIAELTVAQVREQLSLMVNRVMAEGSMYDPDLAALAIKQSRGDTIEAIFLLRAYRTTLPRFGYSTPVNTAAMRCDRRISATYKDLPGGQILGPTFDYTHRLLDFKLLAEDSCVSGKDDMPSSVASPENPAGDIPHVMNFLNDEGLVESTRCDEEVPADLTREPLELPASRALRLQALARADEGFLLSMAYSTQRGYARNHAFVGELRVGFVSVEMDIPELGFSIAIGEIQLTECETVNQFTGSKTEPAQFTRGYGLVFGHAERKAISMALVERALRWQELGEEYVGAPAQDAEFVLYHADNIQATGFLEHIKLPHYVDFQSELELVRTLRRKPGSVLRSNNSMTDEAYNFAYLDEQTKRMIRRALIKALAVPGYQVPFASREMPMPYGWGTGGVQVSAAVLTPEDTFKVIDQGADDTTNAVSIRSFFQRTAKIKTTTETHEATVIQTRHRIPEQPLTAEQILVYQVPIPEPLRFLEPRESETRKMHALEEYGLMHVKLYEDISRHGHIATAYAYPVSVEQRYMMDPSPIPKFDNPKLHHSPAIQLFGAGREQRIYALPPYTKVTSLDFEDYPFEPSKADHACGLCGATDSYLDEVITDDQGGRMFVCSDTDFCMQRQQQGYKGKDAV